MIKAGMETCVCIGKDTAPPSGQTDVSKTHTIPDMRLPAVPQLFQVLHLTYLVCPLLNQNNSY